MFPIEQKKNKIQFHLSLSLSYNPQMSRLTCDKIYFVYLFVIFFRPVFFYNTRILEQKKNVFHRHSRHKKQEQKLSSKKQIRIKNYCII